MRLSLASSLASSLLAIVANSQAGAAAATSIRLGRAPAAEDHMFPEPQPSGGRPRASPPSKAVAARALSLEDRLGPKRGLESLDDVKASSGRELQEFTCLPDDDDPGNPVEFVDCVNGNVKDVGGTCENACNGQCCAGAPPGRHACQGFTGRVCKDGSCNGVNSCHNANIGLVSQSCKADNSCFDTKPGPTVKFLNSCHPGSYGGEASCAILSYQGQTTGDIVNSCQGLRACNLIGKNAAGGVAGGIHNSCLGYEACAGLAVAGKVSEIRNSCQGKWSCSSIAQAHNARVTNGIHDSCIGGQSACAHLAYHGTVSMIFRSCNYAMEACSNDGTMGHEPDHQYSILNGIHTCCNEQDRVCKNKRKDDALPAICPAPPPTNPPTPGPTSSPTPSNIWTLELQDTAATLATNADDDITFAYLIAAGRDYEISLREKGCAKDDEVDETLYTVTKSTAFFNSTHQWLNVSYSLIKAALASSAIWDNSTSTIELCQVTGLTTTDPTLGNLTVAQSVTELEVVVNSVANFTIKANLTGETIFNETEEVDAAAAVKAFKCDTEFEENNEPLSPNAELFTCVGSNDDAFKVDTVDRMTIKQSGKNELKVIDGGLVQIPSITSTEPLAEGIIVRSRIPINLFDFEEGKILTIEGAVTMKLADGSSRRLNVELGSVSRGLQDESNEASYTVEVALEAAEETAVGLSNSAAGVAAAGLKGFAIAAFFLLL